MRQHPSVAGRKLALTSAAALALLCGGVGAACDSTVTSVGAWEPITQRPEPTAGQAGLGGLGGGGGGRGGAATAGALPEGGEPGAGGADEPTGPGLYLEAESGELSSDPMVSDSGYAIISDAAASGGKYILPPAGLVSDLMHGSAQARYTFNLDEAGDYLIWGRIFTPDITSNRLWFQIDGGDFIRWRITVGTIWFWHVFHRDMLYDSPMHFMLAAGPHTLVIANDVPGARLDKLYITNQGDSPPGNTTKCHPPHTIDRGGAECERSCGSQAKPDMPTICCPAGATSFPAYDCTSGSCCFQ